MMIVKEEFDMYQRYEDDTLVPSVRSRRCDYVLRAILRARDSLRLHRRPFRRRLYEGRKTNQAS